jgi:cyclopropane fatty-acyl-phospholipid synthase-like methyltransferase
MGDTFDSTGYYHVAYRPHAIMNPFSMERMQFLGLHIGVRQDSEILDIGSGKGYTSLVFAKHFGAKTTQVDISPLWIESAKKLFQENRLTRTARFLCMDASLYPIQENSYDMIVCFGTAAIFGQFGQAIRMLVPGLKPEGVLVIGEPSIETYAPKPYRNFLQESGWHVHDAQSLFKEIRKQKLEILFTLRSTKAEWDEYMSLQWKAVSDNARENPDDQEAQEYLDWMYDEQEVYLRYQRHFLDWNVFVLRPG